MPVEPGAITISIPPTFELGPLTLAWHGVMIAAGIVAGSLLARRYAEEHELDGDALLTLLGVLVLAGIVGAKLFYVFQTDVEALVRPAEWFEDTGFAFYGAMILGVPAVAVVCRRRRLGWRYLDALAAGFPLGMAVGRLGDVINGEHYGPRTDLPWGFRYSDPDAAVPSTELAYHSGAFYEVLLALAMLAVLWPLRSRFSTPGTLLAATVAAYAAGRFLIFFVIRDTDVVAFGLRQAQLTSLVLVVASGVAWWYLTQKRPPAPGSAPSPASPG